MDKEIIIQRAKKEIEALKKSNDPEERADCLGRAFEIMAQLREEEPQLELEL